MTTDCNNPKHGQFNCIDRLSDLPYFIMHHIISYLDTEDACTTNVLSKRWNQVFATNPILDFFHRKFPTKRIPRYLEYIDTRMQRFSKENLRITTFKLGRRGTDLLLGCKVDEWLEIAVRNQVAEILILRGPANYKLPGILFHAKSLRKLDCHNLEVPYYEALDLVSLECLHLIEVVVEERMLFNIVSSSPLLKELRLSNCHGFKNIVIPRHSKLEDLYIEGDVSKDSGRVILETSSLRSFEYIPNRDEINPWPIISSRGLLKNLRHLCICKLSITDEVLAELLPELASLEKLEIFGCNMLMSITISHTQLKKIRLHNCDTLLNVVIDAPCLKKFKFDGEIDPSLSITISSQASCSIRICPSYFESCGCFKLKKLLGGLNSCDILKILLSDRPSQLKSGEIAEEESGIAELGPGCNIRELKLDVSSYWGISNSSLSTFLNGLFRIRHPNIIFVSLEDSPNTDSVFG